MPRRVRELFKDLERAGFINMGGKRSHRKYRHPNGAQVTLSGNPGDDVKQYQEQEIRKAIEEAGS